MVPVDFVSHLTIAITLATNDNHSNSRELPVFHYPGSRESIYSLSGITELANSAADYQIEEIDYTDWITRIRSINDSKICALVPLKHYFPISHFPSLLGVFDLFLFLCY